jgi:hypothetical protein
MSRDVRVILHDGTEFLGRLFMIMKTTENGVPDKRARKVICLEVGHSKKVVRIDDSRIREVLSVFRNTEAFSLA